LGSSSLIDPLGAICSVVLSLLMTSLVLFGWQVRDFGGERGLHQTPQHPVCAEKQKEQHAGGNS